jgi:transcription factor C subunit 3
LTANPEASVGKNRKWNSLTLAEAERLQAQSDLSAATEQSQQEDAFRVFVSEDRIWQAITGEKRDDTSVTGLEYELLCIIAARKSQGVLQTELIQLSGQDKRSVPKRTDSLQRKGYIEKRPVQAKSVKTSLCTLWRFVNQIPTFSVTQTPAERESKAHQDDSDIIDTKTFVEQIFNVLKEHEIISRNDLKRALGLQDVWRWRILSRTIRKFEVIGCVKRVKAESQYNDTMKATHPCVFLVREPTERDLALFFEDTRQLYTNLDQDNEDDDIDAANQEIVKDPNRKVMQWAPERVHPNIIQDIVTQSGTAGTTNIKLVKKGYGSFFRRSVETTMARLSEAAQYSQPPWLRSKAIVRDVDIDGTTIHYVHYSFPNFAEKVEKGEAKWEAVEFRPKDTKSQTLKMPSFEAKPELDNDDLPPLLRTNRLPGTSLLNVVTTLEPPDHPISASDPTLARGKDGKLSK